MNGLDCSVVVTRAEREAGALTAASRERAAELVRHNGFAVLEGVHDVAYVDSIRERVLNDLDEFAESNPVNRGTQRYRIKLKVEKPYADETLVANPLVMQVVDELLGSDCICSYVAADVALPGSVHQNVHSDAPGAPTTFGPSQLVVNTPLVDFNEKNAPLEIWPGGTQLMPGYFTEIDAMGEELPSVRLMAKRGSVLIRDIRTWHRGTPNTSDGPRPNFALTFGKNVVDPNYQRLDLDPATYRTLSPRVQKLFRLERQPLAPTRVVAGTRRSALEGWDLVRSALRNSIPGPYAQARDVYRKLRGIPAEATGAHGAAGDVRRE